MINFFRGKYFFLSNFYPCPTLHDGIVWPTAEHAYQGAKTLDVDEKNLIKNMYAPTQVKQYSKTMIVRPDWSDVKLAIMEEILRAKFSIPDMQERLLKTGTEELIEGNWWGDIFWGTCNGIGRNELGKLLMKIRTDIRLSLDVPF